MKTKINSRVDGSMREDSYSCSSRSKDTAVSRRHRDNIGSSSYRYDKSTKRNRHDSRIEAYSSKREKSSSGRSSSSSSSSSSSRSRSRSSSGESDERNKDEKKMKRSGNVKRERSDNRTSKSVLGGLTIKKEPFSDGEHSHRTSNDNRSRTWQDRSKRSRWNRSGSKDGTSAVKKERLSDAEEGRWGKATDEGGSGQDKKKPQPNNAKPDFGLSGKLAEETNTYNGVVIKYSEPPEARKPKRRWRLYAFKGDEGLPTLYIHRQSAFLIGRDRKVADIPVDHPSCSKQHAVLQYRLVPFENSVGRSGKRICPYIIDLESANGTFVNNVKIEHKKYVQLLEKDVIKFGFSSREYVLLHEHSKDSDEDDNME